MTSNNFLRGEKVGRLMVRLSLPAISGMIIFSLFSLVDTFFVAQLGIQALAAITLCVPIEILLVSVGSICHRSGDYFAFVTHPGPGELFPG